MCTQIIKLSLRSNTYVFYQVTRFSPDGTKLALGSRDNKVYVYEYNGEEKTFSKLGECEVRTKGYWYFSEILKQKQCLTNWDLLFIHFILLYSSFTISRDTLAS